MTETCPKGGWCDFTPVVDAPDAQVEVCRRCGRKEIYRKEHGTGRIDNSRYLRDHVRDFCQPFGPTQSVYLRTYGWKSLRDHVSVMAARKSPMEIKDSWAEARDVARTAGKQSVA